MNCAMLDWLYTSLIFLRIFQIGSSVFQCLVFFRLGFLILLHKVFCLQNNSESTLKFIDTSISYLHSIAAQFGSYTHTQHEQLRYIILHSRILWMFIWVKTNGGCDTEFKITRTCVETQLMSGAPNINPSLKTAQPQCEVKHWYWPSHGAPC